MSVTVSCTANGDGVSVTLVVVNWVLPTATVSAPFSSASTEAPRSPGVPHHDTATGIFCDGDARPIMLICRA